MIVQDAPNDEVLKILHTGMQMDYKCPDFDSPLFAIKKVALQDGRIVGAAVGKIQMEMYLLLAPGIGAKAKVEVIEALSKEVETSAWKLGMDDLVAYIPESISNKFSKLLSKLKWGKARDGWVTWVRELAEPASPSETRNQ